MRAGQTLVHNGVEVALFPLEYMNISQGENGSYSHRGTLAIDFLGWSNAGRVYRCPYYAPVSSRVVYHASYYNVWQSLNPVITPTGTRYISYVVMHDANPPALGTIKNQGELIGHTGVNAGPSTTPVTGDHVHINTAYGTYEGWVRVSSGKSQLKNSSHIYDTFYVNDTGLINTYGYNWRVYEGGGPQPPTPPTPIPSLSRRNHFNFVLFGNYRKRRDL